MEKQEMPTTPQAGSKPVCGIVMPISAMEGYPKSHWQDVLEIITDACEKAGFTSRLVSSSEDIGVIHRRIIQNLYQDDMIVCDVSGKNANVMFELGIRLAFDQPAIVIKDSVTSYSFDTSPIEHLEYPKDLRFQGIMRFKSELGAKIKGTAESFKKDPNFTTFLKHFGPFKAAKIETVEVSKEDLVLDEVKEVRSLLSSARFDRGMQRPGDIGEVAAFNFRMIEEIKNYLEEHGVDAENISEHFGPLRKVLIAELNPRDVYPRASQFYEALAAILNSLDLPVDRVVRPQAAEQ